MGELHQKEVPRLWKSSAILQRNTLPVLEEVGSDKLIFVQKNNRY